MMHPKTTPPMSARGPRSLATRVLPALLTLLVSLTLTRMVQRNSVNQGARYATDLFKLEWDKQFVEARHDFEAMLNQTYDTLRTVAMLPGIAASKSSQSLPPESRLTVQQIYNNMALRVPVSKLCVVAAEMDPDQIDPLTGQKQRPIATFDAIRVGNTIVSGRKSAKPSNAYTIEEYRAMKDQWQFFQKHFPAMSSSEGLDYPAVSSTELMTSDAGTVAATDSPAQVDSSRRGIVYSVPSYAADGKLNGMVSAVLRTGAMSRVFRQPYFVAARPDPDYAIAAPKLAAEIIPALGVMRQGEAPKGFPYARAEVCVVTDYQQWLLTAAVPTSVLEDFPVYRARAGRGTVILWAGVAISLLLSAVVWTVSSTHFRAIALAQKMTVDLASSERRFRTLVQNIPGAIYRCGTDPDRAIQYVSDGISQIAGRPSDDLGARSLIELIAPEDQLRVRQQVVAALGAVGGQYLVEYRICRPDGEQRWVQDRGQVATGDSGAPPYIDGAILDVNDRKRAEAETEQMHRQLEESSRKAGMAEVASGVLHNVGNVLNSLNVSTTLVTDRLKKSKIPNLGKAVQMMAEHKEDLPAFLTTDEKGRRLPAYLVDLAGFLTQDHASVLNEIKSACENVEHIKAIISTQQAYSKNSTFLSPIRPADLFKDAMRLNASAYRQKQLEVRWALADLPALPLDKHKILQILVNLIGNAKNALDDAPIKLVTLKTEQIDSPQGPHVRFTVTDTGIGISAENLARLFTHGFTTRQEGHGFGLHSAANAAREMGGSLLATSEGPGRGAIFTLEVPITPTADRGVGPDAVASSGRPEKHL